MQPPKSSRTVTCTGPAVTITDLSGHTIGRQAFSGPFPKTIRGTIGYSHPLEEGGPIKFDRSHRSAGSVDQGADASCSTSTGGRRKSPSSAASVGASRPYTSLRNMIWPSGVGCAVQ